MMMNNRIKLETVREKEKERRRGPASSSLVEKEGIAGDIPFGAHVSLRTHRHLLSERDAFTQKPTPTILGSVRIYLKPMGQSFLMMEMMLLLHGCVCVNLVVNFIASLSHSLRVCPLIFCGQRHNWPNHDHHSTRPSLSTRRRGQKDGSLTHLARSG